MWGGRPPADPSTEIVGDLADQLFGRGRIERSLPQIFEQGLVFRNLIVPVDQLDVPGVLEIHDRGDERTSTAYRDQGIRSESDRYRLTDPSLLDSVKEFGDDIQLQILTVFPNLVVQQVYNALAVRQVVPKGPGAMELHWTYLGFADDSPEMRRRRLRQANLVGPAGYVSMEDGCVGGFVQRGVAAAEDTLSVVSMGGEGTESEDTRATEAAVRGFWKAYRGYMGY